MNGGLLGDQVESAEKQLSLVQQPPQMNLQTTASAGPEELSSSMSLEPSAAAVQDIEASAVPESDQAASPVVRRRGRSAGWTPSPSSSPNLPLRSCTATSSTQSGAEDTSEKLDTSFAIVDARSLQQKPADSVAEETPNDLLPEGGIKGGSSDMKSKADERTDLQGEDDVSRRSFELTSEEIPRKRRRVTEAGEFKIRTIVNFWLLLVLSVCVRSTSRFSYSHLVLFQSVNMMSTVPYILSKKSSRKELQKM